MLCIVGIHSTENLLGKEQRIIDSEDLSHYSEQCELAENLGPRMKIVSFRMTAQRYTETPKQKRRS